MSKSQNISILLVIFQPREIKEFVECARNIVADKLWIRWHDLDDACKVSRDWILDNSKYTHAAFITDDLIFTQNDFDTLKHDVKLGHPVISGWANGNTTFGATDSDLSLFLPPEEPHTAQYKDYNFMSIARVQEIMKWCTFFRVRHSGLMLTFLSRKIIKNIPFRTDYGCCRDAMFSHDLAKNRIKQFIDLRVRLKHLKRDDTIWHPLEVGKRSPEVLFEKCQ